MLSEVWIIHGWAQGPGNQKKWSEMINFLDQAGVASNFLEIPGLDSDLEKPWTLDDYVTWLANQLPDRPVILLGHSFGGQLSIRFCAMFPDRVKFLILIGPAGIIDLSLFSISKRKFFGSLAKMGSFLAGSKPMRQIFYKVIGESDYLKADPVMRKTMSLILADQILEDLPKISQPTLLIWGTEDRAAPYKHSDLFRTSVENLVFEPIGGARHSPQFTQPKVVAEKIIKFLKTQRNT
jgi:pimeloyl-ACP methyl ester carboxylesterase